MTRPRPAVQVPMRDGVSASCVALPAGHWPTVLDFLAARFERIPRAEWLGRMQAGDVIDEQGQAVAADQAYPAYTRLYARLYYYRALPPELPVPFEAAVLYQDAHLLVADKPHFLPVVPSGRYLQETLLVRLKRLTGLADLVPVHRIDRDTAGLVLFSVNPATRGAYVALFRERQVVKQYEAIAPWREGLTLPFTHRSRLVDGASFMTVEEVPGTANTETRIELIERYRAWARYRLSPLTGYRHQLRVHMNALGMPILNDLIYPVLAPECPPGVSPDFERPLQLLARLLAFTDPVTGEARAFETRMRLGYRLAG